MHGLDKIVIIQAEKIDLALNVIGKEKISCHPMLFLSSSHLSLSFREYTCHHILLNARLVGGLIAFW